MKKNLKNLFTYILLAIISINIGCDGLDLAPRKGQKNDLPIVDGPALKLAVFPGGGVNAYTSLYSAKLFADETWKGIHTSFDQAWGLSGGSIVASMLMVSHQNDEAQALVDFENIVNASFGLIQPMIAKLRSKSATPEEKNDTNGARRDLFKQEINNAGMNGIVFGTQATEKLVIIAAELSSKKPVYYAHPNLRLPTKSLRTANLTPISTGIINSSNFQPGISLGEKGGLFQIVADTLMDNKRYEVIDGAHVNQSLDDGIRAVSANHPLGLAIDYLKKIRPNNGREHQIVVFDNGSGPGEYAKKLKFNNGYAKVEKDGVIINVYFIAIPDPNFNVRTYDIAPTSFGDRETLVNNAINAAGPSKAIFDRAVNAIR